MALNQFEVEPYLATARTRVTQQFVNKPVFDRYLQLLLSGYEDLQTAIQQTQQLRSVDSATGVQLDIIGDIVGRPRGLVFADIFEYFGFEGAPQAGTFGSLTDPTVGAIWYYPGAPAGMGRVPTDDEYRLIIKAKILKNRTYSTPEDIIQAYKFLFGASGVVVEELGGLVVRIGIGKILSNVERGLLFDLSGVESLLPKTIGVSYEYTEFQFGRVFATEGFPGSMGTGDLFDPDVGGFLTNLTI